MGFTNEQLFEFRKTKATELAHLEGQEGQGDIQSFYARIHRILLLCDYIAEDGLLTNDEGIVISVDDNEFQITTKGSR